jgi:hypothetical protein
VTRSVWIVPGATDPGDGAGIALGRNGVEALTALGALDAAVADGRAITRWTIID